MKKALRSTIALLLAATLGLTLPSVASAAPVRARDGRDAQTTMLATRRSAATAPAVAGERVIVRLKGRPTAEKLEQIYDSADTSSGAVGVVRGDVIAWRIPEGDTPKTFAEKLEDSGQVAYAEPNYLRPLAAYTPPVFVEPNDPAWKDTETWGYQDDGGNWTEQYPFAKSWWMRDVAGVTAWSKGYTGANLVGKYPLRADGDAFKVAVLDTGLYTSHPDRSGFMIAGSADIVPPDPALGPYPHTTPDNVRANVGYVSHGTCVAGIVAATTGNGVGTLGVAKDTRVAMYKVYSGGSGIEDADIIAALRQAADTGSKVINLSIAGGPYSQALQDAIDYAWGKGCVIVAASGNDGASTVSYPAALNHVVAVGALANNASAQRTRAEFSNFGSQLDISAPGAWIWGLTRPGYVEDEYSEAGYKWWDGTSMASPVVAGGIAWLWRAAPWMTNEDVVALVQGTATDLGTAGRDNVYGHGDFNMLAAYNKLTTDYPLLQKPTITVISASNAAKMKISWTPVSGYNVTYRVTLDSTEVTGSTTATAATLPATTIGAHTITVTASSPRNWMDGTAKDSVTVNPPTATPEVISFSYYRGQLLWSDTQAGQTHTDRLSIDGGLPQVVTGESTSTTSLSLGSHTATLTVQNTSGVVSAPATLTFTVRPSPTVKRITAADRYRYSTALSRSTFESATTAVLVGSKSWMDAFSAAPLARVVRGPVLPTSRTALPSTTKAELKRLGVKKIIIVGNTSDVSAALRNSLAKRYSVSRITGSDRYLTANAVARSIAARSGGRVPGGMAVVVGDSLSSAMSASAVAARKGWPLLYSRSTEIPATTRSTLTAIGATSTLLVGNTSMVSDDAMAELPWPTRISGTPTLSIPAQLATWATANYPEDFSGEQVRLASNSRWSNSLGLPAAAADDGALVLLTPVALAAPVHGYFTANSEVAVTTRVIGSSTAISNTAVNTIKAVVGAP